MRLVANDGIWKLQRGLLALGLLALGAGGASAQMVFDNNLIFNNNASGTFPGQFVGAPTAAAGCDPAMNAAYLGTTEFTHNVYQDPLLPTAPYLPNVVPNFQPGPYSPAFNMGAATLPNDGFFEQVCYVGAIGPNPGDDWTNTGATAIQPRWVNYDTTGATRQDLHLPGMPNPRPLAIYDHIRIVTNMTWSPDSNYLVRGFLRINNPNASTNASLTIPAGVVVFEERATTGTIVVERGGKIFAIGTADSPITITGDDAPGSMATGAGGGIYMLGRAKTNVVNSCAGDTAAAEGGDVGYYGGNDDSDSSGELRYVRVEFAGKEITPNNELNSFTWCGCGTGTKAEYLEAFRGVDDDFEFFGGINDLKHAIGIDGDDDGFDWQLGYRGRGQFIIIRATPYISPAGDQNGDKGIEADNNEFNFTQLQCSGRSNSTVANFTFVGDKRTGPLYPGPTSAVNLRRGTAGSVLNGICYNFKTGALKIDDDATWQPHCAALPTAPATFCPNVLDVPAGVTGRVFVVRSAPNPFRNRVNFNFTLPTAGEVRVDIYSAAGQRVAQLSPGLLSAGEHNLSWTLDGTTPGGVYFYKVVANSATSSGKITRVD